MAENTIESLAWDTGFFGYPTAKIKFATDSINIDNVLYEILSRKIKLTYFFVPPEATDLNTEIVNKGGLLVDQKTIFSKVPEQHFDFKNPISEYAQSAFDEKLLQLAFIAGTYSRFQLDNNFTNQEFERLYSEWLKKSVEKQIAFKTLVAIKDSEIVGIITLKKEDSSINIGLLSVHTKYQGHGIGLDLIQNADACAFNLGYKEIIVATQLQNHGACKLYSKSGFQIKNVTNVYHYWLK